MLCFMMHPSAWRENNQENFVFCETPRPQLIFVSTNSLGILFFKPAYFFSQRGVGLIKVYAENINYDFLQA